MKACPACGAEYESHVEHCFIDGSVLVTGNVALPTYTQEHLPPELLDEPKRSKMPLFAAMVVMILTAIVMFLGGAVSVLLATRPEPVQAEAQGTPEEQAPGEPMVYLAFTSEPGGALVSEGGTGLCTTPCKVAHPEEAPLPRTFSLTRASYLEAIVTVEDPWTPQHAKLQKLQPGSRSDVRVRQPAPVPAAPPAPTKPTPIDELELAR